MSDSDRTERADPPLQPVTTAYPRLPNQPTLARADGSSLKLVHWVAEVCLLSLDDCGLAWSSRAS